MLLQARQALLQHFKRTAARPSQMLDSVVPLCKCSTQCVLLVGCPYGGKEVASMACYNSSMLQGQQGRLLPGFGQDFKEKSLFDSTRCGLEARQID